MNPFSMNNKQPYQMTSPFGAMPGMGLSGFGGFGAPGSMATGFRGPSGLPGQLAGLMGNLAPWGGGGGYPGGLSSGFVPPPSGVPYQQSPYGMFGSPFGLGLNMWRGGFGGIGAQFPDNLWTQPTPAQSPQSPVAAPGPGAGGDQNSNLMDIMKFNQTGQWSGGMGNPASWGAANQGPPGYRDVFGNQTPQFVQDYWDVRS